MRYDDWDVLLFPIDWESKIPLKEFRVACHVISDTELSHAHGSLEIPIMTCFIPSLTPTARFHISIHSWEHPTVSQFTRAYSKHSESARFEARVLIDGRMVAVTYFDRNGPWPHIISSTCELTKSGEHEPLRFPHFRCELLYQDHWNPGDDIGRIKIVISEGFPRDSLSAPIERVKNLVSFSFQHAPLDILERNGIAWPNPSMWLRPPLNPVSTYPEGGAELHTHSPRRRCMSTKPSTIHGFPGSLAPGLPPPSQPGGLLPNPSVTCGASFVPQDVPATADSSFADTFDDPLYADWVASLTNCGSTIGGGRAVWPANNQDSNKKSGTDTNMPDIVPSPPKQGSFGEPMHISGPSLEDDRVPSNVGLKVPTNTPTSGNLTIGSSDGSPFSFQTGILNMSADLATSLTQSLLNQPLPLPIAPQNIPLPASEVKSRKEKRHHYTLAASNQVSTTSTPRADQPQIRKFAQPGFSLGRISAGAAKSGISSPSSHTIFSDSSSGNSSGVSFGADVASESPTITPLGEASSSTINQASGNANSGQKGTKRVQNEMPASAKATDTKCEPPQTSTLDRIGAGYVGDTTVSE